MKKTYLLGAILATTSIFAQTNKLVKISTKSLRSTRSSIERTSNPTVTPAAIAASITCPTQYTAGSTVTLNLTLNLSNTDNEYGDSLAITLPAGFTITAATPTDSLGVSEAPTTGASGCATTDGGTKEPFKGIVGSTVSWGNNDNCWGGLPSGTNAGSTMNITLTVNVAANVAGPQTANFHVSGDGFGAAPSDFNGTFVINAAGTVVVDLSTNVVVPMNLTAVRNCGYGQDTVLAQVRNLGTDTAKNVKVYYSVNGVAQPFTVASDIAPGDSTVVGFLPKYDFSPSNLYLVKAWTAEANDATIANDTASLTFINSVPTALTSTNYVSGLEPGYDYTSFVREIISGTVNFGSTATVHSGTGATFYTIGKPTSGTVSGEASLTTPCLDLTAGDVYRITYWKRSNAGNMGEHAVAFNTTQSSTGATEIKAYSAITANSQWSKDSVDYTATATGTGYFVFKGRGTATTALGVNVRFDDITIAKFVAPNGIVKNTANTGVNVFPNPTSGLVTITVANTALVEVYNLVGEKIAAKNITSSGSVDLSTFASGAYYVKVISNEGTVTKKVILNK